MKKVDTDLAGLPGCVGEFIGLVVRKMGYRRSIRRDVRAELIGHFEDELKNFEGAEREEKAERLIEGFGDVKVLAKLLKRAKKRCRPLWRTVVARSFQAVGVIIILFFLYTGWFLTGKATVSVDYFALLTQMSRPEINESENAWPYYENAIKLFVEPNDALRKMLNKKFSDLSEIEQGEVAKWVGENEKAWEEFVAGSLKPYYYTEYKIKDKKEKRLANILFPYLASYRNLAKLGMSRIEIEEHNTAQAMEDCLTLVRVSNHLQQRKLIVEQLTGLAINALGYALILDIAGAGNLTADDLLQLQQKLEGIYPKGYPLFDLSNERLCFQDTVQYLFTEGGPGGGHIIPQQLIKLVELVNDIQVIGYKPSYRPIETLMPAAYTAVGIVHAGRDETIRKCNEIYDRFIEISKLTPYQRHINNIVAQDIILTLPAYRYLLIEIFTSGLDRIIEISYRRKISCEATETVLAILRYEKEKGSLPESLTELIEAGYLKEVPMDPWSDEALKYRKTDGDFVLYSVGWNFVDDGGEPGKGYEGGNRTWADNGDAVFWPVLE